MLKCSQPRHFLVGNRCLTEDGLVAYQYFIKSRRVLPLYLPDHVPKRNGISRNLRNRNDNTPLISTERYENSFFQYNIKAWKVLGEEERPYPPFRLSKDITMVLFDPLGTPYLEMSNLELRFSVKLELVFLIYA